MRALHLYQTPEQEAKNIYDLVRERNAAAVELEAAKRGHASSRTSMLEMLAKHKQMAAEIERLQRELGSCRRETTKRYEQDEALLRECWPVIKYAAGSMAVYTRLKERLGYDNATKTA